MSKHKNDIYGDVDKDAEADYPPAIPAATVLLLRDHDGSLEVLMLHKTSKIAFGGMWVFPGGKIDEADYAGQDDDNVAAVNAAVRETEEEAGITLAKDKFVWFAHWTPPPSNMKRFSTWFFVTDLADDQDIQIDGGEIQNYQWMSPAVALEKHANGEIDLAPPTWVSLYQLSLFATADDAVDYLATQTPRYYQTRIAQDDDGSRIALWDGDSGYEDWSAVTGENTHRLVMHKDGFRFLHSAVKYQLQP